jgi:CspA family cold shock protein
MPGIDHSGAAYASNNGFPGRLGPKTLVRENVDSPIPMPDTWARQEGKQEAEEMATGTVKWFNDAKGFGFIEPDGGGSDVFAHFSAIAMDGFKTLKQGSRVTFEITQGPKGQLAQNIHAEPGTGRIETIPVQPGSERPPRHSKVRAPQFHAASHGDPMGKS